MKSVALAWLCLMPFAVSSAAESANVVPPAVWSDFDITVKAMAGDLGALGDAGAGGAACGQLESVTMSCPATSVSNGFFGGSDCVTPDGYIFEFYNMPLTAGAQTTLRMTTSTSQMLLLAVYAPGSGGQEVASGNGFNATTVTFTPAVTGTYRVGVAFVGKFVTGAYTLTLNCGTTSTPPPAGSCTQISLLNCNDQIIGSISGSDCVHYSDGSKSDGFDIQVTKGYPVTVRMRGDFDGYLEFEENTSSVVQGAYGGRSRDFTVTYTPTVSGFIRLWVTPFEATGSGGYVINMTCPAVSICKTRSALH